MTHIKELFFKELDYLPVSQLDPGERLNSIIRYWQLSLNYYSNLLTTSNAKHLP